VAMTHSTAPDPSFPRRSRAEHRWLAALAAGGVLASVTASSFLIGLNWRAPDHEELIVRMAAACREDERQSYLMYEACREANEQAVDAGVVPLPALDPAPMTPPNRRGP
jgi:hypothetical protein